MPKKKKRKHQNRKRRPSPPPTRAASPLMQSMAVINRMKPVMAASGSGNTEPEQEAEKL